MTDRSSGTFKAVPFCPDPWSEVVPGLHQGGHVRLDERGRQRPVHVGYDFDLVVSLYAKRGHGPAPDVHHMEYLIPDGYLHAYQLSEVEDLADEVAAAVQRDEQVLVRCQAGYNRSGLVVALTLLRMGWKPAAAIDLIRARRSPYALCNSYFERYVFTAGAALNREAKR